MLKSVRQHKIVDAVKRNGNLTVAELQGMLNVSEMTIRRDLRELENTSAINRVHGGVISIETTESTFSDRSVANLVQKTAIAYRAVELITPGCTVFIDGSSTCGELAGILPSNIKFTVFTDSLKILTSLSSYVNITLISLGGELEWDRNTFDGAIALENALQISVDLCFFSAAGFNQQGVNNGGMIGTLVKKTMLRNSKKRCLLVDSSKYGKYGVITLCKWDSIDIVVSDSNLPAEARDLLKTNDVELLPAELTTGESH